MQKIVIDIYGGDAGHTPIVNGVIGALREGMDVFPVLVGHTDHIRPLMQAAGIADDRYEIVHAERFITNDDPPTSVFAGHDDTSMVMAYKRLKSDDTCTALLSAGNTGALLVGSICHLGLHPGLKTPALAGHIPSFTDERFMCLVDCGANIDCTAADLLKFATMGSVFIRCYCGTERPRVALMSVGREAHKGTPLTRDAFELLSRSPLNFIGNMEGNDLADTYADVIVADGFAGNILLKNTEAVCKATLHFIERSNPDADPTLMSRIREQVLSRFDLNTYGGATFLGTKKTVVKMHGCANDHTATACIGQILKLENAGFSQAMALAMKQS